MMFRRKNIPQCALETLKKVGLKKGQSVLDCCCGCGNYTLPAAKLVGNKGLVYAIDTNQTKLDDLKQKIISGIFGNIKIIQENVDQRISLLDSSVDVILLYDIFWYFRPNEEKLSRLLHEVSRISKPNALVSVFPAHIDTKQLGNFIEEIVSYGFSLENRLRTNLVHDGSIEQGELLNFRFIGGK